MRITRCFVATPLTAGAAMVLPEGPSAHVARVLRLRAGAELTLFDGHGGEYEAHIVAMRRDAVQVQLGAHRAIERESPLAVTLLQSIARGERMDWIIQKAAELGVAALVPLITEHSVVQLDAKLAARKREHWQAVAISACEQCGRNRIPPVQAAVDFERACAVASGAGAASGDAGSDTAHRTRILLAPDGARSLATAIAEARALTLLIGPEGGLSTREIAIAEHYGFESCRLGPRILRTETAPLAALAAIQALAGDLGS